MFDIDVALAQRALEQRGFVTVEDCRALGLCATSRKDRVSSGLLVRRHDGVYRHAGHPPTFEGELLAATMAAPGVVGASGPSVMRLYGVRGEWSSRPEITILGTEHLVLDGVRVRRIDRLDAADLTLRHGIPCLAPPLATLLLGASAPPWKVETAVHDLVFQRLTTRARLVDVLVRYGGPGRRGTTAFRSAVSSLDPNGNATQTNFELTMLRLMRDAGIPEPLLQHGVVDATGRRRRLDFAWPDQMVDVETDGDPWHLSPAHRRADAARDAALEAIGWHVERFGASEVELRPQLAVARLAALFGR